MLFVSSWLAKHEDPVLKLLWLMASSASRLLCPMCPMCPIWPICLIGPASHRGRKPSRRAPWRYHRHKASPAGAPALSTSPMQATGFLELCTNMVRAGGLKNSDQALPKESIVKQRGMKVGKGAKSWLNDVAAKATRLTPNQNWCVKVQH